MAKHYTSLYLHCDARVPGPDKKLVPCKTEATFDNPGGVAPYLMDAEARQAGWYLAISGKDLCPYHHRQEAAKYGWVSLYEPPSPRGVPIERERPN